MTPQDGAAAFSQAAIVAPSPTEEADAAVEALRRMSVREHVKRILPEDDDHHFSLQFWGNGFMDMYEDRFLDLENHTVARRLAVNRQLGLKSNRKPGEPLPQMRWEHCRLTAAINIAIGLHRGLPFKLIANLALAGLLHDFGHSAFGHDADNALVNLCGYSGHERRGLKIVQTDEEIHRVLELCGVDLADVLTVMAETGPFGMVQSLADTLSYVEIDCRVIDIDLSDDFIWQVIKPITYVGDSTVSVRNTGPIQRLLDVRACMYQQLYRSLRGKIYNAAFAQVLKFAFTVGALQPEMVVNGTDDQVIGALRNMFNRGFRVAKWIRSCWKIVNGYMKELKRWESHSFATSDEFEQAARKMQFEGVLLVPYYDFGRKVVSVTTPDGTVHNLRAQVNFQMPVDNLYYILVFKG
ncbi:MAG: HD domain-containing protein [bacterium]